MTKAQYDPCQEFVHKCFKNLPNIVAQSVEGLMAHQAQIICRKSHLLYQLYNFVMSLCDANG